MRHRYLRPALTMPQIYLYRVPIDFRKQAHGLAALVEQQLGHNPFTGALYAFTNRRRNKIKCLMWEDNGFVLVSAAKSTYLPSLYCATFFAMGSSGTFQGSRASSFSRLSASPICASTWLIYADGSRSLALAVSSNE